MNLLLGGTLEAVGLLFGPQVPVLLGLLPVWALAGFLAYAGLRHASLVRDLRGASMAIALSCGVLGAAVGNLAITAGLALLADHGLRVLRVRARNVQASD
jgi:hypothetical protein